MKLPTVWDVGKVRPSAKANESRVKSNAKVNNWKSKPNKRCYTQRAVSVRERRRKEESQSQRGEREREISLLAAWPAFVKLQRGKKIEGKIVWRRHGNDDVNWKPKLPRQRILFATPPGVPPYLPFNRQVFSSSGQSLSAYLSTRWVHFWDTDTRAVADADTRYFDLDSGVMTFRWQRACISA